jgi:Ni,Fe-hydrogenase I small subunit
VTKSVRNSLKEDRIKYKNLTKGGIEFMRITRRDFMKYCSIAAGALGLTASNLMKIEKALATDLENGGTQVIWINGASCTGCTVSLANTAYLSTIQDLLVPWELAAPHVAATAGMSTASLVGIIGGGTLTDTGTNGPLDLAFMETLSTSVGHRAVQAAKEAAHAGGFVLAIEGAIQTANGGDFCRIGDGSNATDTATISFMEEVREFALDSNCVAILAVGTCASYGGIPAARGQETGARGLISTGRFAGAGYGTVNTTGLWDYFKDTDSLTDSVASISISNGGSGYTAVPTVTISAASHVLGEDATATAAISGGSVTAITVTDGGWGYLGTASVTIDPPGGGGTTATAAATMANANWITTAQWEALLGKTICIPGCPPHPDWIVGTITYLLDSAPDYYAPLMDKYHRPWSYYGEYQCSNCVWQTNDPGQRNSYSTAPQLLDIKNQNQQLTTKGGPTEGNSPKLYFNLYNSQYEGCIGILGCKGRKTKADCGWRRWNAEVLNNGGTGWCVLTRAGCHGCTEPRWPDAFGQMFMFK